MTHPCQGKCSQFDGEPCRTCLITGYRVGDVHPTHQPDTRTNQIAKAADERLLQLINQGPVVVAAIAEVK